MNHLDLFSGIGGFALAGSWVWGDDYVPVAHSDVDETACRLYHKRFGESRCLGDIKKINWGEMLFNTLTEKQKEIFMGRVKDKKYDHIVKMYDDGMSIGEIAEYYETSRQAMHELLKRRGCKFRDNKKFGEENHFYRGTKASDKAQNITEKAIERGALKRAECCEQCGAKGKNKAGNNIVQAHHCDYNKPLDVMWLCQKCHHNWHASNTAIPREEVMPKEVSESFQIDLITGGFPERANHSAKQEEEVEQTITVTSGLRCLEQYPKSDQDGSSLKTCVAYLLSTKDWYSKRCALVWRTRVTKSNRLLFQLSPLTRHTEETECGLSDAELAMIPTPTVSNTEGAPVKNVELRNGSFSRTNKKGVRHGVKTQDVIAMLPTPIAGDWKGQKRKDGTASMLSGVLENSTMTKNGPRMIPTPAARDWKGAGTRSGETTPCIIEGRTGHKTGLKLQPIFVEWMMGYPLYWTDLNYQPPHTESND